MTIADRPVSVRAAGPTARPAVRWSARQYLAVGGVVFLVWQACAWIPWFADGVTSVHSPNPHAASRTTAIVYQIVAVAMVIGVVTWVIRGCRRAGRLTLDAKICIAGLFTWWMDPLCNWIQPVFLFSSNWVNVRDWTGHVPFVVNPQAGQGVELPLFTLPMYCCGFLVNALMIGFLWRRLQQRWPSLRAPQLILIGVAAGAVIEVLMETPVYLTHAWAYPGAPKFGGIPIGGQRFPWIEWLTGGIANATIAAVRYFKDDAGRSFIERGRRGGRGRRQELTSVLAMIGYINTLWLCLNLSYGIVGLYSAPYPTNLPADVLNGACNPPGTTGSSFGPCPGSPGYRVPITPTYVSGSSPP